jgi:KDO2-lipid IV(A) lauroyltransferase
MVTYYLVVPFLYLFSYLPTDVLYKLADALAFVLRKVIKYRRDVVFKNLRNSFPEKSEAEIQQIAKESYTHLADRVIENIKCLHITEEEFMRRCKLDDKSAALLNRLYNEGRDIVVMVAHTGAWEWGGYVANRNTPYTTYGVYSPVKNKYFNKLVIETRGQMGMHLVSMASTSDYFKQRKEERTLHVFFTDQSPSNPANAYWTKFMHQDTAFFYGGARYAIKHNCVPVYTHVQQVKRGYYTIHLDVIAEDVSNISPDKIVQGFADRLEKQLHDYPADWLWSHKRWKHSKP